MRSTDFQIFSQLLKVQSWFNWKRIFILYHKKYFLYLNFIFKWRLAVQSSFVISSICFFFNQTLVNMRETLMGIITRLDLIYWHHVIALRNLNVIRYLLCDCVYLIAYWYIYVIYFHLFIWGLQKLKWTRASIRWLYQTDFFLICVNFINIWTNLNGR